MTIQCIRSVFKHAFDAGLIAAPVRFGPGFKRPTKKTLRLHRAEQGPQAVHRRRNPPDARRRRRSAEGDDPPRRQLRLRQQRLRQPADDRPWTWTPDGIDYPRPKTGIRRRCALWPETVQAVREALAKRPTPKDEADAGLVFITKYGGPWARTRPDSPITKEIPQTPRQAEHERRSRLLYAPPHVPHRRGRGEGPAGRDYIMGHEERTWQASTGRRSATRG